MKPDRVRIVHRKACDEPEDEEETKSFRDTLRMVEQLTNERIDRINELIDKMQEITLGNDRMSVILAHRVCAVHVNYDTTTSLPVRHVDNATEIIARRYVAASHRQGGLH